ncbi:MAG: metal ABC transporter permease [Ilumatobacteraceae bacterium]|jgi:manganese/iron transport system permease protein/iron/zinc/copper transport system permease protein|nr:metal ABC transporter permease [Ilumatobacteraceae bacterium]
MMIAGILDPYRYDFFTNGILVATIAGALCGLLGVFVVLRGLSYIGHGLSHSVFGGAAASAVMGLNYFVGAGIWGVTSGIIIGRIARRRLIGADAAIGVVTTASFALGLALLNRYGQAKKSIEAVLFGSVLGVETVDIIAVSVVAILTAVLVFGLYRHLLFATFDPEVAQVSGIKVSWVEALLMGMLSLTILVTMRVIGTLLISALLVIPASVARMLTNSFSRMLWISPLVGATSAFIGMNLAYHLDTSASATIILVGTLMFIVVYAVSGLRGRSRIAHIHHV